MVRKILKHVQVFFWEYSMRRSLLRKFRLYGPYKRIYKWKKYSSLREHLELFKPLKCRIISKWYKYFTLVRQEEDPAFLPEDVWHIKLEPALNQRSYAKAFNDKNLFDFQEYRDLFPRTYLHVIRGVCYDRNYNTISELDGQSKIPTGRGFVVKKAIDSGGGKGVAFYNAGQYSLSNLIARHGNDIVLQEHAQQSAWFARLNPDSVNTIRVVTYRSVADEKVHVLQTLLRIGKPGSHVDNQSSGGIACGIDQNGRVNSWGCDKLSEKFTYTNGIALGQLENIPNFGDLKKICIEIASKRLHERVLVFDTWQDNKNRIRLMEINNINIGIEDLQKNNGPMFGRFTKEVIDWCAKNPKSYCFDYEL